ncbi:MAG: GNAT family N-acetyltransferase [Solirubrobacteraceae bacterium]
MLLLEYHVWYALDLTAERPRRELDAGLTLRRGDESDVSLLTELPTISPEQARTRLARGNALWLVLEGADPRFACWIFRDQTPVIAAPGGEMRLAAGTACLEDSVTAAAARGRGVAPAAWTSIADGLGAEGLRELITKIEVANLPSRRAVEKIGFRPVALMRFVRIGPRGHLRVDEIDLDRGARIAAMLGRG